MEDAGWLGLTAAVTLALVSIRARIGDAHVALVYLVLVLIVSSRRGRRVGLVLATVCFLAFNFFFVVPYGTFAVHDPLDWLVLLAFWATSAIGAHLLHVAQAEAAAARLRASEMHRLATLGAEALQAPRAEEAAAAITRVIREELRMQRCELYQRDPLTDRLHLVAVATPTSTEVAARDGVPEQSAADVILASDARTLLVPLHVRARSVGLLRLHSDTVIPPNAARHPFAEALAYYAALGVERIRLTTAAAHADALREADRLKDAVLSGVSHDLRTPLTTIKAIAREIAADGDDRAALIETEADRLNRYVSNLLDLSRLNAGSLPVTLEIVPMEDLLGAAMQQVAGLARGREVRADVNGDVPMVIGRLDFVLTLRAITNLIENALRYSPADQPVEVRAAREAASIRVDVIDYGPGIPESDRDRVFEPFQRGNEAHDPHGVGLGLPIARRLVEAQGGTLTYASGRERGTVFSIVLPAADIDEIDEESL